MTNFALNFCIVLYGSCHGWQGKFIGDVIASTRQNHSSQDLSLSFESKSDLFFFFLATLHIISSPFGLVM